MVEYSEEQKRIAKLLLEKPMTLEELREKSGLSASAVNDALAGLVKLRVVERVENKYKLIDLIEKKLKPQVEDNVRAVLIIEGISPEKEALEKQMALLEDKIKLEPMKIIRFEKGEVEKQDEDYSSFFEIEAWFSSLEDLFKVIINYGPSSVHLLEPKSFSLKANEAQSLVNTVVSAVHYYTSLIIMQKFKEYLQKKKKSSD